jgi:hypothetical protein
MSLAILRNSGLADLPGYSSALDCMQSPDGTWPRAAFYTGPEPPSLTRLVGLRGTDHRILPRGRCPFDSASAR